MKKVLWIDDEIDRLKPHILFLKNKGLEIQTATNGFDGIKHVKEQKFDIVILDEMMVGMTGLEALEEIKIIDPDLAAIMLTKSEEEDVFMRAIGEEIADYLTKPVSPVQLYLTIKKNCEKKELVSNSIEESFFEKTAEIERLLNNSVEVEDWVEINSILCDLGLKCDRVENKKLENELYFIKNKVNNLFGEYIKSNYESWFSEQKNTRTPLLSPDIMPKIILKDHLKRARVSSQTKTAVIVIDSLRTDQLRSLKTFFGDFGLSERAYYSILPSTTKFSRPALLGGALPKDFPADLQKTSPLEEEELTGWYLNKGIVEAEEILLKNLLKENNISTLKSDFFYTNLSKVGEAINFKKQQINLEKHKFVTVSFSLLDFIASHNSNDLMSELVMTDRSYRNTLKNWYENSLLRDILENFINEDFIVYLVSSHGSQKMDRYSELSSVKELSKGTRYRFGKSIKVKNKKQTFFVQVPGKIGLAEHYNGYNMVLSTEDYGFVDENQLGLFFSGVKNSYQHGGISLEEMVIPVLRINKNKS